MKYVFFTTLFAAISFTPMVHAQVSVDDPWVRATVAQQRATGAFMKLTSPKGVRVIEVASPAAAIVEIHEMTMEGDVMRMRALESLDLPAGETVELEPGGYHVMLIDLKEQVQDGDVIPLTLVVEDADGNREIIELSAPARPLTHQHQSDRGRQGHQHGHKH